MKKISIILFLMGNYTPVLAQVLIALVFGEKLQSETLTFGLVVSPTFSNISEIGGKLRTGFGLGLYFDIKISNDFFLHPEMHPKASFGAEDLPPYATGIDSLDAFFVNGSVERKFRAMSVPLLCRYRIKGLLFAEAGPQIDWILKVKDIYTTDVNGDEVTYTTEVGEQFTRFDIGFAAGLHCKLKKDKGMGLGVRYFVGMTDIMKNRESKQVNQAFTINVLIPIGTGNGSVDQTNVK